MIAYSILLIFLVAVVAAAVMDLLTMTIPNKINLILLVAFVAFAAVTQMPLQTFGMHLGAGALVLAVSFGLFALGAIGGGDAKFAAAVGLWMGFGFLADFLLLAALIGGPLTIAFWILKQTPLPPVLASQAWLARLSDRNSGVPYGLALAPAAAIVFLQTPFAQSVMGI